MDKDATLYDMIKNVRADEANHRFVKCVARPRWRHRSRTAALTPSFAPDPQPHARLSQCVDLPPCPPTCAAMTDAGLCLPRADQRNDFNPFAIAEPDETLKATVPGFTRDEAAAFAKRSKAALEAKAKAAEEKGEL